MLTSEEVSQMNGEVVSSNDQSWLDFCEQKATAASEEFALAVRMYLQEHPCSLSVGPSVGTSSNSSRPSAFQDFATKFVEYFLEHFESHAKLKHPGNALAAAGGSRGASPHNSPHRSPRKTLPPSAIELWCRNSNPHGAGPGWSTRTSGLSTTRSHTFDVADGAASSGTGSATGSLQRLGLSHSHEHVNNHGEYHDDQSESGPSPTKQSKSFFRRFSIRGIKNNIRPLRQLFKQHSDESEFTYNSSLNESTSKKGKVKSDKGDKTKMAKMLVECVKEGIVNQLVDEDFCGKTKWKKCRLVLVKTTGGCMLEFFIPPKVLHCYASYACIQLASYKFSA